VAHRPLRSVVALAALSDINAGMKIQNNVTVIDQGDNVRVWYRPNSAYFVEGPGPDKLPPAFRIREPVSATRAPPSALSLLLPLRPRVKVELLSPKRRSKLGRRFVASGRPRTGEEDCSRRGEAYAEGDPKEDERDGGGFVG
jgi:hypothetical protein